jgi:hypothetical protein
MITALFHGDIGLLIRILVGCAIFTSLAIGDLRRHGPKATRWREYGVLVAAVIAALLYGAINDQFTVTLSPEYFIYGKEINKTLGDNPPMPALRWEAAKVGLKATWSAGLIFGVVLLIANNPCRDLPRLRNRQLILSLPVILITAAAGGGIGGWLGYHGHLTRFDSDFADMLAVNLYRPYRFMSAWGVHLGGYVGGLIGTVIAAIIVCSNRVRKRRAINRSDPAGRIELHA